MFNKLARRRTTSSSAAAVNLPPFSPDHAFMTGWPEHTVAQILDIASQDPAQDKTFAKLRAWIGKHPETQLHLTIREIPPDATPVCFDFCKCALKSQILESFRFLSQCDEHLADPVLFARDSLPDHPFPGGSRLCIVARIWQECLQIRHAVSLVNQEIREDVVARIEDVRTTVSMIIALLASSDALPPSFLAVVHFATFSVRPISIIRSRPKLGAFLRFRQERQNALQTTLRRITDVALQYEDGGQWGNPDAQVDWFQEYVGRFAGNCDPEKGCLRVGIDPIELMDFLTGPPKAITYPIFAHFAEPENQNAEGLKSFIDRIIDQFDFKEAGNYKVVYMLLANLLAPAFVPDVKLDGSGTTDQEVTNFTLEFVMIGDPNALLGLIADRCADNIADGVENVAGMLATITAAWKELLDFVYRFTMPGYLNAKMNAVRTGLGHFLGQ
jgi:hypothetical protein